MHDDITESVKEKFAITCNNCGSSNVKIEFYSGFVHDSGGSCGYLYITCEDCENHINPD